MSEYFDPAFLRSLDALRVLARRVPAAGRHAEQRSRQRGAGIEFTDVRPYVPGDDFRGVDWHLFQRLDRVFVRVYLEDQDLPVYILLDQSRSMDLAPPAAAAKHARRKTVIARQAVAAMAYVTLAHMDRVSVLPFAGSDLTPLPGLAGRRAFHRLLGWLAELPAAGGTGLIAALDRLAHRRLRRGLCIVISDLFDPAGPDAVLSALGALRHSLLVLRPVHPGEAEPALSGELQVVDCETGQDLTITVDDEVRRRYRDAYTSFAARLDATCAGLSGRALELRSDLDVAEQLTSLFPRGVLSA